MKFTKTHDWILMEGDIATIGITDYAQKELGEIVYVELPHLGYHIQPGGEVAVLESTKAAVDIYAPIGGEVIEVNTSLHQEPQKINDSPQSDGWLYKIRLKTKPPLDSLMDQDAYQHYLVGP